MILETDQILCYDKKGEQIPCAGSGQDAVNKEKRETSPPWLLISEKIAKDYRTGLIWARNAALSEFPMTWEESWSFVSNMNIKGYSGLHDWRLPTRSELFSLISHQYINPALPRRHPFSNVFNGYYWTKTTCAQWPNQAWYVHLGGGRVQRGMKHGSYMVWPVSEQKTKFSVEKRFHIEDWLILDHWTDRQWMLHHPDLLTPMDWMSAIEAVYGMNNQNFCGYSDWRLPNIRELDTLVDTTHHAPAFSKNFPVGRHAAGYWSSTTSVYEPSYAWVLYPDDGAVGVGHKESAVFQPILIRTPTTDISRKKRVSSMRPS